MGFVDDNDGNFRRFFKVLRRTAISDWPIAV